MKRLILSIGVLPLLSPVFAFEALYHSWLIDFGHLHPAEPSPQLLQDALWIAHGETLWSGVTRLWAGNFFHCQRAPGTRAAGQLARRFMPDGGHALERGLHEAALTVWFSRHMSEAEMKRYLPEHTQFGGASGAFAASWLRFHKRLDELTPGETATLAALSVSSNPEFVKRQRDFILRKLHENGRLTDQQFNDALAEQN